MDSPFINSSGECIEIPLLIRSLDAPVTTSFDNIPDAKEALYKALCACGSIDILDIIDNDIIVLSNKRTVALKASLHKKKVSFTSSLSLQPAELQPTQFEAGDWLSVVKHIESTNITSDNTTLYIAGILDAFLHTHTITHAQHAYWCQKMGI